MYSESTMTSADLSWSCPGATARLTPFWMLLLLLRWWLLMMTASTSGVSGGGGGGVQQSPFNHAKRLYHEKLSSDAYNKLIRPVGNTSDTLTVRIGLRLVSIIDIDEKNQIMTTNVWLEQEWYDYKLMWNPEEYGHVEKLYVPSDAIWLPDIVLYNSADGNFTVKIMTKATVYYTGRVVWNPPSIYKSLCLINVEYFPFDEQLCTLKIGSWSYDGNSVDIRHNKLTDADHDLDEITDGINIADYSSSTEWDLLGVPAQKFIKHYPCCSEPYPDIKFNIVMRRKTLYHTVNLILPCVAICAVTLLVFFIPAYTGEKITMAVTILNSLNIFLLLVAEINPPTSLATPLIGKYLLFTMVLVTCSIVVTVFVLNVHFRSPSTHVMPPWIRHLFLYVLSRLLFMQRPQDKRSMRGGGGAGGSSSSRRSPSFGGHGGGDYAASDAAGLVESSYGGGGGQWWSSDHHADDDPEEDGGGLTSHEDADNWTNMAAMGGLSSSSSRSRSSRGALPPNVMQAVIGVSFIAEHLKEQDESDRVKQDWQFVAMVMDRLFMWMFTAVSLVGTFGIIIQSPTLYDGKTPIG